MGQVHPSSAPLVAARHLDGGCEYNHYSIVDMASSRASCTLAPSFVAHSSDAELSASNTVLDGRC